MIQFPAKVVRESISDIFTKYHLNYDKDQEYLDGMQPVLHRFHKPDPSYPHNHPWGFTSHILSGGYLEEVWEKRAGVWEYQKIWRHSGTSHYTHQGIVHRIIELEREEPTWTLVMAGPVVQRVEFFDIIDGVPIKVPS